MQGPTLSQGPDRPSGAALLQRQHPYRGQRADGQCPCSRPTTGHTPKAVTAASPTDRLIIVALDPGHGGEDPGAIGPNGTQEKMWRCKSHTKGCASASTRPK